MSYYGNQKERVELRHNLAEVTKGKGDYEWDVLITTYNLAQGASADRKFLKDIAWKVCNSYRHQGEPIADAVQSIVDGDRPVSSMRDMS